jgi:hypothetical protein
MLGASFAGVLVGFFSMNTVIGFFAFLVFLIFYKMFRLGIVTFLQTPNLVGENNEK